MPLLAGPSPPSLQDHAHKHTRALGVEVAGHVESIQELPALVQDGAPGWRGQLRAQVEVPLGLPSLRISVAEVYRSVDI